MTGPVRSTRAASDAHRKGAGNAANRLPLTEKARHRPGTFPGARRVLSGGTMASSDSTSTSPHSHRHRHRHPHPHARSPRLHALRLPARSGGLVALAMGAAGAIGWISFAILLPACGDYAPPDVANYGPPNSLGQKVPGTPPGEDAGSSAPPPSSGSGGGDSGAVTGGDGGAPAAPAVACVTAGGTLVAPATCSVSWKTDIYPKMQNGGAWNCASASCHGAGSVTQPVLSGTTEASFYTVLANYTGTVASGTGAGQTYINPCSTDPTKSEFVCNTQASGACGAAAMPLGAPVASPTAIATWVACGAPEN
jgi:hypothetical protein